jgi:hypothetical protein
VAETIIAPRNEIDKSTVAQILQLLANLRPDVLVAGIAIAEMPLEGIDFVKREVALPKRLHAFHDVEQPASRFQRLAPEKERLLPVGKDEFFRTNDTILDDVNFPGFRDAAEQDIGADPPGTPCSRRQRLSLLDNISDKKVFGDDEEIYDCERFEIVIHEKEIRIVAGGEPFALGLEGAIDDPRSKLAFLLSSNSSLQDGQKKSASGLLFGNEEILALPQCGQYAQAFTHVSVHERAFCEPLV